MSSHLIKRGIALWKSGQKIEARKVFATIINNDRENESAWLWYIYTMETNPEKIEGLKSFLVIFPEHVTARKALASLEQEQQNESWKPSLETSQEKKGAIPEVKLVPVQTLQPVGRSQFNPLPWVLVVVGLCLLLLSSTAFVMRYNSLRAKYQSLAADRELISQNMAKLTRDYNSLQSENTSLSNQYKSLSSEHSTLQGKYNTLNNDYSILSENYEGLSREHASLTNSYNELLGVYNSTVDDYSAFRETAIVPPYIYIHGREVQLAFLTPSQELYTWSVPFDALERDLKRGNSERSRIAIDPTYPRIVLDNSDIGQSYEEIDYRRFVDPRIFTSFSGYFYDRAPSEEVFIREIWYIVAQLTAYSSEITDTPRYPLETLLAGGGDCEDHAILYASMILAAAPSDWKVDLVYMDSDHPTDPQTINHMIVYIETGNRTYTVEATGKESMEPYTKGVHGWYSEIEH